MTTTKKSSQTIPETKKPRNLIPVLLIKRLALVKMNLRMINKPLSFNSEKIEVYFKIGYYTKKVSKR